MNISIFKLSVLSANIIKVNQTYDSHKSLKVKILEVTVYALGGGDCLLTS